MRDVTRTRVVGMAFVPLAIDALKEALVDAFIDVFVFMHVIVCVRFNLYSTVRLQPGRLLGDGTTATPSSPTNSHSVQ